MAAARPLTPLQQAEQVRQVVGVLRRMEQRFDRGAWSPGPRFDPAGGTDLVGGIDEATGWAIPGVAEEVTERLVTHLPRPFRAIASAKPRLALVLYNGTVGGRSGALRLVRGALADLGLGSRSQRVAAWTGGSSSRSSRAA